MTPPLVSVIVPVYNQEKYLHTMLDSICNQTYRNLEIILVDDGSTDSSPQIISEYARKDSRIISLSQQNKYAGTARNYGAEVATGEYYSFLDSDDIFEHNMYELMVNCAEENNSDVVICLADSFDHSGSIIPMPWQMRNNFLQGINRKDFCVYKELPHAAFQFGIGWAWDKLYRSSYVKGKKFKFSPTRHANDSPFAFPSVIMAEHVSIVDTRTPLAHYRRSDSQLSTTKGMMKAPLSFFVSAKMISDKLTELNAPKDVLNSFACWIADYVGFTLRRIYGPPRTAMVEEIVKKFEPQQKVAKCLRKLSTNERYSEIFSMYKHNINLYLDIVSKSKYVDFSNKSIAFKISKLGNWPKRVLFSRREIMDEPEMEIITIMGIDLKVKKRK